MARNGSNSAAFSPGENLLQNAGITVHGGERAGNGFSGHAGAAFTAEFSAPAAVNTVILRGSGTSCCGFSVEAKIGGEFRQIYAQDDKIGEYRYCAFPEVETTALRVTVRQAEDQFTLTSVEAYCAPKKRVPDFRVTAYLTAETAYDTDALRARAGSLDCITDIIFFGAVRFSADGTLYYPDLEAEDGTKADGKTVFQTALQNLREVTNGRDIRIHCNFLGPDVDSANERCEQHTLAFGKNRNTLIAAILQFVEANGFDGIFFDYEYPRRLKDWLTFSRFLTALKKEIHGRFVLGAAVPVWKNLWEALLARPLDVAEIMGYDAFDADGHHAAFTATASRLVANYQGLGFARKRLDLGMPFYARPVDGGLYWYAYREEAHTLGTSCNIAQGALANFPETQGEAAPTRYYNGWQMIYDKTAYALDADLGGVMVWHYGYDLPSADALSLFGAIQQAIEDRTIYRKSL